MASKKSLRKDSYTFLIGYTSNQIVGSKLPSIRQALSVLFYNMREVHLNLHESSKLVIKEVSVFWQKARIPISSEQYCVIKLQKLYNEWRNLQKLQYRKTDTQLKKNEEFSLILDDLFDIAQVDAIDIIKIKEDREFLVSQRQKGRPGSMLGIDLKIINKEKRAEGRSKMFEERRKRTYEESEIRGQ